MTCGVLLVAWVTGQWVTLTRHMRTPHGVTCHWGTRHCWSLRMGDAVGLLHGPRSQEAASTAVRRLLLQRQLSGAGGVSAAGSAAGMCVCRLTPSLHSAHRRLLCRLLQCTLEDLNRYSYWWLHCEEARPAWADDFPHLAALRNHVRRALLAANLEVCFVRWCVDVCVLKTTKRRPSVCVYVCVGGGARGGGMELCVYAQDRG